ncbi:MAG TPA: phosphate acyltransferase PlsX [Gemmataceae bacterium]|jgi:glycerol-3-phosphate acyltransferase PlsX|nr:phosphate acyltransferase PlsX [Gemmataceae bacterium]
MRIALDAMGGDHAPGPIVAGAVQAVADDPDIQVTLVGDREPIEAAVAKAGGQLGDRLTVHHCTQQVTMDESPVEALRKKPDNSISRTWQLMAERKVDAIVSAGNTGAMVAGGLRLRRFLKGVRRPGIATVMPTAKGPCVVIDVGANVAPKPSHLFAYGVMGSIFARHILQRERPTIGLMNVGSEQAKGNELAKDTHALFESSPLADRFIGNIEGRDIHRGACDVVVTDGFLGNVVLKVCEGVFDFVMKMIVHELHKSLNAERQLAHETLMRLIHTHDYSAYGGAPLLGIDGICIICHGSSGDRAIKNALGVAAKYARAGLNDIIVRELATAPVPVADDD